MTLKEIGQEVLRLETIVTECHQVRESLRTEPQYSRSVLVARRDFIEAQGKYRDFLASDLVTEALKKAAK